MKKLLVLIAILASFSGMVFPIVSYAQLQYYDANRNPVDVPVWGGDFYKIDGTPVHVNAVEGNTSGYYDTNGQPVYLSDPYNSSLPHPPQLFDAHQNPIDFSAAGNGTALVVTPAPTTPAPTTPAPPPPSGSGSYEALSPITLPGNGGTVPTNNFPNYLQAIYKIGIGACFALGVIMFTWAGIEYIVSESMGGKSEGKQRMTNALIGLGIALASYILLQTINPDLLTFKSLNVTPATAPAPAATAN